MSVSLPSLAACHAAVNVFGLLCRLDIVMYRIYDENQGLL
jgi:hypothetical protein